MWSEGRVWGHTGTLSGFCSFLAAWPWACLSHGPCVSPSSHRLALVHAVWEARCRPWPQARRAHVCPVHLLCLWGSHSRSQPRRLPATEATEPPPVGPHWQDLLASTMPSVPPPHCFPPQPSSDAAHGSVGRRTYPSLCLLPLCEMVPPAPPRAAPTLIYFLPTPKLIPTRPSKLSLVSPPCVLRQCPVVPEWTARPNTSQSPPFISGHRRLLGRGQVSGFQSLVCPVAAACRCP